MGKVRRSKGGKGKIEIKHPGALHRDLGIKPGAPIPVGRLQSAANSSDKVVAKRAQFALNARSFSHAKK